MFVCLLILIKAKITIKEFVHVPIYYPNDAYFTLFVMLYYLIIYLFAIVLFV